MNYQDRSSRRRLARRFVPAALVLTAASLGHSQNPAIDFVEVAVGRATYNKTCANQYCHGADGKAGRAPALAGRGFERDHVLRITQEGVANTAMPGWKDQLPAEDIQAVVTYVMTLQETTHQEEQNLAPDRPWLDHPGRELFFDATRVGACGSCHLFDGWGVGVAPAFRAVPESVADLRGYAGSAVQTADVSGETAFPALPVETNEERVAVYDLTAKLPVLRSIRKDRIDLEAGTSWKHADVLAIYSDEELGSILEFLLQASAD